MTDLKKNGEELADAALDRVAGGGNGRHCTAPASVRQDAQCQEGETYCYTCQYYPAP